MDRGPNNGDDIHVSLPAVILAAGEGCRLQKGNGGVPKPLTRVLGLTLLERAVLSCREAGVSECYVVIGSQEKNILPLVEHLGQRNGISVRAVRNPNWEKGNGTSLLAVAPFLSGSFFVIMCDHLFDPDILRCLRKAAQKTGACLLAVDRKIDRIFNWSDTTKVRIEGYAITDIGKEIARFNAADTGLFLCRSALFEALGKAGRAGDSSLTGGIRELARRRGVQAVEIGNRFWLDVDTPEDLTHASRTLLSRLSKPEEDGFVSRYINRPLSGRISQQLTRTSLTPNAITILSFLITLGGAILFSLGEYAWTLLAGVLIQLASVTDGCDGEVARLKFKASRFGAWFDTILDRYGDIAIAVGIVSGRWLADPAPYVWLGGTLALTGLILPSYMKKEYVLLYRHSLPYRWTDKILKRDVRLFALFAGACLNVPFEALLGVGFLSHLGIAGTFLATYRREAATQLPGRGDVDGKLPRRQITLSTRSVEGNPFLTEPVAASVIAPSRVSQRARRHKALQEFPVEDKNPA